ncbi:MAG TPA: tRNA pseudouridine(38-40) synthase TruA [Patescibacteria group bacterium]|nr:tRNA pseudouridine(38-40) synthase TruA [Patescibacteria group bacterium]
MARRTLKLTIEYDGADYCGWQVQPDRRTVQGELYRAFDGLAEGPVHIVGAGRTDAGVHAAGQVAGVHLDTKHAPEVLLRAVNARLPGDIRVRSLEEASPHFNARFDARSRTYQYIFIRRPTALWRRRFYIVQGGLDIRAMRAALASLHGKHDFTSFASSSDDYTAKNCAVVRAELIELPPLLILEVEADHFLHHMVRTVAGTALEIGRGKPWHVGEIIAARDRARSGPTLPPYALYLKSVSYQGHPWR